MNIETRLQNELDNSALRFAGLIGFAGAAIVADLVFGWNMSKKQEREFEKVAKETFFELGANAILLECVKGTPLGSIPIQELPPPAFAPIQMVQWDLSTPSVPRPAVVARKARVAKRAARAVRRSARKVVRRSISSRPV